MPLQKLEESADDGSTFILPFDVADENGLPVIPNTLHWSLRNGDSEIINSRDQEEVADLSSSIDIVTLAADNLYADGSLRYVTIEYTYDSDAGTDLIGTAEARYKINNFKGIE